MNLPSKCLKTFYTNRSLVYMSMVEYIEAWLMDLGRLLKQHSTLTLRSNVVFITCTCTDEVVYYLSAPSWYEDTHILIHVG